MQDAADVHGISSQFFSPFHCEIADADDPFRLQAFDDFCQMSVAGGEQCRSLRCREFVRSAIASALFQEGEGAEIDHDVLLKKILSRSETFREEPPKSFAADFRTRTGKARDEPRGMLIFGSAHGGLNAEPIAHGLDFAERHAGLNHAERAGIHPEKDDALPTVSITPKVEFMGRPGVIERIIDVANGRREGQFVDGSAETPGGFDEGIG